MAFFPMFVDLTGADCLVVGGGRIACHKVKILLDFEAKVQVISREFDEGLRVLEKNSRDRLCLVEKVYEDSDCEGRSLVVAATDDGNVNHQVANACKSRGIPVNAVDQKEDCTFIFPSYVKEGKLVAAFSSGGNSPLLTQVLKEEEKERLTPFLGSLNDRLGECREYVQQRVLLPEKRKEIYGRIYEISLQENEVMSLERIREMMEDEL